MTGSVNIKATVKENKEYGRNANDKETEKQYEFYVINEEKSEIKQLTKPKQKEIPSTGERKKTIE